MKHPVRLAMMAALVILCLTGCGTTQVIVVPVGNAVILTEPIHGPIKVLAKHDGQWVEGQVDSIPAGWACWYVDQSDLK